MSNIIVEMKGTTDDINDLLNNLCLNDPPDNNNLEKIEKVTITSEKSSVKDLNLKNNSSEDSGYEDDKDNKDELYDLIGTEKNGNKIPEVPHHKKIVSLNKERENPNDELSDQSNNISTDLSTKYVEPDSTTIAVNTKVKKCHQDLIITENKEVSEKQLDPNENEDLDTALKNQKDVEDSGYIRRTGKTLLTPTHDTLYGQVTYNNMAKPFPLDDISGCSNDSFNQFDVNSRQSFSPYVLSSEINSMNNFCSPQSNQGYFYSESPNAGGWYDSPQSSPSPYQIDSANMDFRNISQDSDSDVNSCSGGTFLTPPPSVSPPKFLDGSSPCHQSCIQIVDLIGKVDQSTIGGNRPEDELKNLLSALDCEQDISLWGMSVNIIEQNMLKDIQETDISELSVYLPNNLNVDEAERAVMSTCDPQTLFELKRRVSAVLSNNPMAIIPDDQHGDTNLIVLASRDKDRRDNIIEKIYALAKGLSNVRVCCKAPVDNFQCMSCGNTNPDYFHTPLTLYNTQGYTALSCAVLRGYPTVIVTYLVALIQSNKQDLAREFRGDRNKLYLSATEYPYLSNYVTRCAPVN